MKMNALDCKIQSLAIKLMLCGDTFNLEDLQELTVALRQWKIENGKY